MKSVLIICFNDLKNDARVTRQISFFKDKYAVTAACFDMNQDSSVEFYKLEKPNLTTMRKVILSVFLLARLYHLAYRILYNNSLAVNNLSKRRFDLIVANDVETLPVAFAIRSGNGKLFLDAHEYSPRQFEDRRYWRIFFQKFVVDVCRRYIPRVDGMSTINEGIASAYHENFGIRPIVITNATDFIDLKPRPRIDYPIRLVHHGIFNVSRQPFLMVEMMQLLDDRFTLDLIYLLPQHASPQTLSFFQEFKTRAEATGKIRVRPALKSSEIVPTLHREFDMGIILVPPVNFNYENGLPNKLFDCIQARIAMAVGPLREIANVVASHQIGIVSEDFTAKGLASALSKLNLDMLNEFKANSDAAAQKMNASINKKLMLDAVEKLFA